MPKIIKVAKGSYTATDITVDSSGRVITATSGSGGNFANGLFPAFRVNSGSGTYTATANANFLAVYARGGGGRGGTGHPGPGARGAQGGAGGFSFFVMPISQPYSVPYVVGAAAAATSLNTNDVISNGGSKGSNAPGPTTPATTPGTVGTATCPSATSGADASVFGKFGGGFPAQPTGTPNYMVGLELTSGQGGPGTSHAGHSPVAGSGGGLSIFENI